MDYRNYDRGYAEPTMSASDYMTRTYRWMACGLLITFAMAYLTATTSLIYLVDSLYLVLTIAELALVFVLSSRVQTMSVGAARATFFGYALLNGMVLSYYFLVFSASTLIMALLATSLYFGLMAVYGTTTHKDLTGWGPRLMMALVAMIITGFVGMLFGFGKSVFSKTSTNGIWFAGIGTVLTVLALLLCVGYNNTAYYPSTADLQSSLTLANSCSSEFTLRVMAYVSVLVPFVLAYIVYAWRAIDRKPITAQELEKDGHTY